MVPTEPQRTHMSFDGLGNVFGALGVEIIARKVEGRQRPDGRTDISGETLDILGLTGTWE